MGRGLDAGIWPGVWAAHLGLVRLADDGIGRVLDALRASPAAGNTLTVFTVDHGDHLGQRGMYQKMELYEPAIRIPLIIRAPGAAARRVDDAGVAPRRRADGAGERGAARRRRISTENRCSKR